MLTRGAALLAAVTTALTGLTVLAASPTHAAAPTKILIAGDSITLGRHTDYTWRYRLDKELRRQHVAFDFVGSDTIPYVDKGYPASRYADPNFDHNFYAKAGHGFGPFPSQPSRNLSAAVVDQVQQYQPDVVVIELGAADLLYTLYDPGSGARTSTSPQDAADETANRLRTFITNARAVKPNLRIVVTNVLTMDQTIKARNPAMNQAVTLYNQDEQQVASELSVPEVSPVTVARTQDHWDPTSGLSVDGLHLSPTGETLYAQRVAEDFYREGILPQAPHIYHVVPWSYTQRPRLTRTGHALTVTWSRQMVTGATIRFQRVGKAARTYGTYRAGKATYRLEPGASYSIALRLQRYRLSGAWGPSVTIHVPNNKRTHHR
jgi:lysophospholipase L1-like esterase